jgi:putative ABC transport system substrate-binding protein
MNRRDLLATLASTLIWPMLAAAQQPARVPVVGMLITHPPVSDPVVGALRAGLGRFGYEDGRNIRLEVRTALGQLNLVDGIASELVRLRVDVIVVANEVALRAVQRATSTIPIVSIGFGQDPVKAGVIDSFGRPGANVTGLYMLFVELDGKRLEILKEALPRVSRAAVFWGPGITSRFNELKRVAQTLDIRLEFVEVRGPEDLEPAFKAARHKKVGAVMLLTSPIFYLERDRVASLALGARLPTLAALDPIVEAGGLMSYGPDTLDTFGRAAYYVDRLLKGATPAELPVEQVSKIKLMVNLKTAKALGITIPESILLRADEVIR